MNVRRTGAYVLVAATALAFGFLLATQVRTGLLVPGNRVARSEALVRTVQDLEKTNTQQRGQIARLQSEINDLEARAAQRSDAARRLQDEVAGLRAHAGATTLRGPGVTVDIANGRPGNDEPGKTGYVINFEDIQDVVNLLFGGGAEGVAVNGHRITPLSSFTGSGSTVLIDQGNPMSSPFHVAAVGNRNQIEQLLAEPASLGDLRNRQRRFGVAIGYQGSSDLTLPAFDSALETRYARTS
jgi:uncharacterized protein YlxW (UPF0749 family)